MKLSEKMKPDTTEAARLLYISCALPLTRVCWLLLKGSLHMSVNLNIASSPTHSPYILTVKSFLYGA